MRCPKCGCTGFDVAEQCGGCGYDVAVAAGEVIKPDLPVRMGNESLGPMVDVTLRDGGAAVGPARDVLSVDDVELPLFPDQATRLAVGVEPATLQSVPLSSSDCWPTASRNPPGAVLAPSLGRILAGLIDVMLLGAVNGAVMLLTLRLCGLTMSEWVALPLAPIAGFLLLFDGGYLVAFTAVGGQTIGKMACRLKVVSAGGEPVSSSKAVLRAMAFLLSVLPLGLGFIVQFGDRHRRALHDRLAETRVVKVS
ncbi:MAG: RDD family protein [Acidobacteriota bacterium]|nr:RDD family protein [Acidobacteriota bacterium]|tara:strand:- start:7764 stop:8519 length:756 start_codon:yes stop_codon:yes gene_type:complete